MPKISEVLIKSQTTRKQTTGKLINPASKVSEIIEYCALGALACEMNLFKDRLESEAFPYLKQPLQQEILAAYGVISKQDDMIHCSVCDGNYDEDYSEDGCYRSRDLADYIVHLNDFHGQTFEQIGKLMQEMGY